MHNATRTMKSMKLSKTIKQNIIKVILGHKKPQKIVIFGSRSAGTNSKTSDIDIAIFGKRWSDTDINVVKNLLEENVKTPLKFDVLNYYAVSKDTLKKNIIKTGKVIYDSGKDK